MKENGEKFLPLNLEKVTSVYSGKPNKCCCGCAGKHYYASATRARAGKARGYAVTDEDISDRMVKKVVAALNKAAIFECVAEDFRSAIWQGRLYIAYMH